MNYGKMTDGWIGGKTNSMYFKEMKATRVERRTRHIIIYNGAKEREWKRMDDG